MTDLVKHEDGALFAKMEYAKAIAPGDLLPRQYRDKPANVLIAMEYGEALGLTPMAAIQGVHIIEGKPSASADLIASLIRKAGHILRVTGDDKSATAVVIRKDDPDFEYKVTWTIEEARAAGLAGKDNWKKHPRQMLKRRAISEVGKDACPDVLSGLVDHDEAEEAAGRAASPTVTAARLVPDATAEEPVVDTDTGEIIEDAEIVEDEEPATEPITDAQMKKLHVLLKKHGVGNRDDGLEMISNILARQVDSTKDLSKDDASVVIDTLEQFPALDGDQ